MSDELIRRSDVMLCIECARTPTAYGEEVRRKILDGVMRIPSADRQQGEWIPCSERLPEDGEDVLAWIETRYDSRIACCNYYKGGWFDAITDALVKPAAWMPLPEPYKGADDE